MTRRTAALVTLTLLLLLGLAAALLAPGLVRARIQRAAAAHEISTGDISLAGLRTIRVAHIETTRAGLHLRCDDLRATVRLRDALRGEARLTSLTIQRCASRELPDEADHDTPASAPPAGPAQRLRDAIDATERALASARSRAEHVVVRRLVHHHEVDGRALDVTLDDLRLRATDRVTTVSGHVTSDGAVTLDAARLRLWNDGRGLRAELLPSGPIAIEELDMTARVVRVALGDDRRVEAHEVHVSRATGPVAALHAREISASLDDVPLVAVHGGATDLRSLGFLTGGAADEASGADAARTAGTPVTRHGAAEHDAARQPGGEHGDATGSGDDEDPASSRRSARRRERSRTLTAQRDEAPVDANVWSLRTVGRLQAAAAAAIALIDRLPQDDALPVQLRVSDLGVEWEERELLRVANLSLGPGTPLEIAVTLDGSSAAVRAVDSARRSWRLDVDGAPLSPFVRPFELEEHISGNVRLMARLEIDDERLELTSEFVVRDGRLEHPAVSPVALEAMRLEGAVHAHVEAGATGSLGASGRVSFNGVDWDWSVMVPVERRGRFVRAELGLSSATPCATLWGAVPAGLVPDIGHGSVRFTGEAQPRFTVDYRLGDFESFTLGASGFPGSCTVEVTNPRFDPSRLNGPRYVHHVREGVTRDDIFVGPGTRDWVALGTLPSYLPAVMYLSEEIGFYRNEGISLPLINKAIRYSLPRGRFAYGGSTVTQQLVKNLFLTRTKTLSRKFQEAVLVWAVESTLTKDRILELYLNCIEFGPDIYGIERAARHYFNRPASRLTPLEAAWLASLKPSPLRGGRDFRRGSTEGTAPWNVARLETLLRRMVHYGGHIEASEVEHYAPYVVALPGSPVWDRARVPLVERPEGAWERTRYGTPRGASAATEAGDEPHAGPGDDAPREREQLLFDPSQVFAD